MSRVCVSKGNRVNIPEPGRGGGRQRKRAQRRRRGSQEEFSFLFNSSESLESDYPEIGSRSWESTARRAVSGAPSTVHENLGERHSDRAWSYSSPHQVSKVNSL